MMQGRARPDRWRRPFACLASAGAVILLAATAFAAGVPHGAVCIEGDAPDCAHILTATAALAAMLASGDPAAAEAHLAGDAQVTLSNGQRLDRAGFVAAVRAAPRADTASLDHAEARITGNVAVVTWEESWAGGARTIGTDVWQRRTEGWRIVASIEVRPTH